GGAGGMHACAVAELLNIERIIAPADAGLLSARGLQEALQEEIVVEQLLAPLEALIEMLPERVDHCWRQAISQFASDGIPADLLEIREQKLAVRLVGQESVLWVDASDPDAIRATFETAYNETFGYRPHGKTLEAVTLRVIVSTKPSPPTTATFDRSGAPEPQET